jgi:hypothetical protein
LPFFFFLTFGPYGAEACSCPLLVEVPVLTALMWLADFLRLVPILSLAIFFSLLGLNGLQQSLLLFFNPS